MLTGVPILNEDICPMKIGRTGDSEGFEGRLLYNPSEPYNEDRSSVDPNQSEAEWLGKIQKMQS